MRLTACGRSRSGSVLGLGLSRSRTRSRRHKPEEGPWGANVPWANVRRGRELSVTVQDEGFEPTTPPRKGSGPGSESGSGSAATSSPFRQRIKVGKKHTLISDEPESVGGADAGPSPYDLLLGALGACTSMTLRMYATRRKLPLEGVCVQLDHAKVYLDDCEACTEEQVASVGAKAQGKAQGKGKGKRPQIDKIDRVITLHGKDLTPKDRASLLRIANLCPVHKTLESSSVVATSLKEPEESGASASDESNKNAEGDADSASPELSLNALIASRTRVLVPGETPEFVVRRLLPSRLKRAVGPFIFADHFGPVEVGDGAGQARPMDVGPHPHIGLATLTYLFQGAMIHNDSTGTVGKAILPKQVNYMVAGRGVVHSERGVPALGLYEPDEAGRKVLHGMQMWTALPKELEDTEPAFHHSAKVPDVSALLRDGGDGGDSGDGTEKDEGGDGGDVQATLVVGRLGDASVDDIPAAWPMVMVDVALGAGARIRIKAEPGHELCAYVVQGRVEAGPERSVLDLGESAVYAGGPGAAGVLRVTATEAATRIVVFGGLPLPEPRHMFWNFAASDKDMLRAASQAWEALDRTKFPKVAGESNEDSIPLP